MTAAGPVASPAPAVTRPAAPAAAPSAVPAGREPGPQARPGSAAPGGRRWRAPLILAAVVIIGGVLITLLQPRPPATGYLDPAGTGSYGGHALADLLTGRGATVIRQTTPGGAAAAAGQPGSTLVITSPEYLSRGQLAALAAAGASIVLVEPTAAALAVLAPQARMRSPLLPLAAVPPRCQLPAAVAAGAADAGNIGLALRPGTAGFACYPVLGADSLVRYQAGGRAVTVLGSGLGLANGQLADQGNAALALNLLGRGRIVWLVPPPAAGAGSGRKTFTSLVPLAAWLVAAQLGVALLLTAAWRGRRLGPLIAERLPVVVRAAETVEGHGRLYASRRARDRAAAALRAAVAVRVLPALGLPPGAGPAVVGGALAARSGQPAERVTGMMYGPPPDSDAALVALAADLDALEREVLGP